MSSAEALSTFKLALSMRSAAPRIEAHYQFYRTAIQPHLDGSQEGCGQWVLSDGTQYCSPAMDQARGSVSAPTNERDLPFDTTLGRGRVVVLYADITSRDFGKFHKALAEKARQGELSYRVRHHRDAGAELEPLAVNGYGVELALKRTDYIVIDDRDADGDAPQKAAAAAAPAASEVVVLDGEEEVADLKALSKSEVSELGMKAADFIMQSETPFDTLVKLTQDFPKYSTSVLGHNVSEGFATEHRGNRMELVPPGVNVLWMNGVQLIERQIQSFTLLDIVRRERKLINGMLELGLTGREAVALLGHPDVASSKTEDEPQRFDWRDEDEDGRVIVWLNNLEKDSRYAQFPKSLFTLLQPGMPGQIPPVRRDIFNQIYAVDLSKEADVQLLVDQLFGFVKRLLPIRFGFVPLTSSPEAAEQAKIAYHLVETYGLSAMIAYLQDSLDARRTAKADAKIFAAVVKGKTARSESAPLSFEDILASEEHEKQIQLAAHWANRLGANSPVPPIFVDGIAVPRDEQWLQIMSGRLNMHLRNIQEGLFYGLIEEDMWIPNHFLQNAARRRNSYVFPDGDKSLKILDVNKLYAEHSDLFSQIPAIETSEDSTKETWAVLIIAADLESEQGLKLLLSALQFRQDNPGIRLDIIHNPASVDSAAAVNDKLRGELQQLAAADSLDSLKSLVAGLATGSSPQYEAALARFLEAAAIKPGANMLILNGRVVGPITEADGFKAEDFLMFLEFEQSNRILPVYKAIDDLNLTSRVSSPLAAAKLTSITALSTISDLPEGIFESAPTLRISAFNVWNSTYTAFEMGDASTANIHFTAVVNPASEQGQRWVPLLKVLSELAGVYLKVFLNPRDRLEELPIKRFYRSVLESAPTFDESGKVRALGAEFKGLPSEALLNLGMEVPPAWLVAPKESVHDLDNIKLSSAKSNIEATYELENILIEGHSRGPTGQPPRGVQLVLGTEADKHFADTIVMANLGFFQFKANPGYYNIQLQDGRSADIFEIESVGSKGMAEVPGDEGTDVALMDFQGTTLYPRLTRRPGMEEEDVLDEGRNSSAGGGAMDFVAKGLKFAEGILGGASKQPEAKGLSASDSEHAEINIFSVASGHLYERMLNIMMVSVMRHTNHTVKFWFIEQFLSPSFKDFIPAMAAEYGFRYEMVTYKWPHWLRQQKEKQREIWGYKILFLDVLFPLSLDKVIFVDADQIVRTDMHELVRLDLEGAPYGFTPMCDSRTEMEGFRFWKQGYWSNYLKGLPYHISALYVVDLRRFRELAAGDRLRQTYHQLSADPQSLANLDQDLPNHMQFSIPIHSLPQDWLWCETWCSDDTFPTAKTIDLCNNPLTKEPKLDRARRQVPEWTAYDDEIAALDRRRKGLPVDAKKDDPPAQKVLAGETEKNTKSRTLEEKEGVHTKDEL